MDRVRQRIKLGLKATSRFQIKMTIQSLYDQRAIFAKLVQIFNSDGFSEHYSLKYNNPTMTKIYASGFINNLLKHFQNATESLGKCGDLKVPTNGLFFEEKKGAKTMGELEADMKRKQKAERDVELKKIRQEEL